MLLSVIVPIYNAARWLDQCIDSITTSRFSDFELLLINDGSTDSSSQICRNHAKADTRLRVYDKPNGGVSSARNFALDRAQGKWLTFCDADDFVSPDLFAELIGVAQQAPHLEFVHGGCTNYREKFSGGVRIRLSNNMLQKYPTTRNCSLTTSVGYFIQSCSCAK